MAETNLNKAEDASLRGKGIDSGAAVILVLHSPREKCWGVLDELNAAGVFLRGLDLNSFDDWLRAVLHGPDGTPMQRDAVVFSLLADELVGSPAGALPLEALDAGGARVS